MITLYRRGEVYWTRTCENGLEVRASLRTRDKEVARQLVRQMEIDLLSGGKLREVCWPEFQEEFLQWIAPQVKPSTIRGYRITAKRFGRFLEPSGGRLSEINSSTISAFLEARRFDVHPSTKRNPGPGGIKFDLRCLRRIFSYAIECGYLPANPVRQRNIGSTPRGTLPFTQAEIDKMLKHVTAGPQQRAIVLTFLHTGLRIGDVIRLTKAEVRGETMHLNTRKRDKVVTLRVHPELRKALTAHFAAQSPVQRRSRYVFTTENGKPIVSLARDLRRLWKRAGIPGGHAHRFRDTIAVRLLSNGASLYDVSKILGNTAAVVERYYAPYVEDLQKRSAQLIEKLAFV